jgi:hypothetical protein
MMKSEEYKRGYEAGYRDGQRDIARIMANQQRLRDQLPTTVRWGADRFNQPLRDRT